MSATVAKIDKVRDHLLADLSEAAFEVTAQHGTYGSSVDQELELWQALGRVLRRPCKGIPSRSGSPTRMPREDFVAELTEAAYQVSLQRGFDGSFVDLKMDLWHTLGKVVKENRLVRVLCGAPCASVSA